MTIQNDYDNYSLAGAVGQPNMLPAHCRVINSGEGATRTLLADESGAVCLFDRAAGIVYTLPETAPVGTYYDFLTTVTITSNAAKVGTAIATHYLLGGVDSGSVTIAEGGGFWAANGTSHIAISSNGSTTGGVIGSNYRITRLTSTVWGITGVINGTGTIATPFAT